MRNPPALSNIATSRTVRTVGVARTSEKVPPMELTVCQTASPSASRWQVSTTTVAPKRSTSPGVI